MLRSKGDGKRGAPVCFTELGSSATSSGFKHLFELLNARHMSSVSFVFTTQEVLHPALMQEPTIYSSEVS